MNHNGIPQMRFPMRAPQRHNMNRNPYPIRNSIVRSSTHVRTPLPNPSPGSSTPVNSSATQNASATRATTPIQNRTILAQADTFKKEPSPVVNSSVSSSQVHTPTSFVNATPNRITIIEGKNTGQASAMTLKMNTPATSYSNKRPLDGEYTGTFGAKPQNHGAKSEEGAKKNNVADSAKMEEENEVEDENEIKEKKFVSNCRLFIGNIPNDMSESEFESLFSKYGNYKEPFLNAQRGFGFVKMDTRHHAELVRSKLDGMFVKNSRIRLRVRFAGNINAVRVKHLSQFVSNEMLEETFKMFGEVERAIVVLDERGKPTGEGIVEFARKSVALVATKKINEGIFLMTASMRPIEVEPLELKDEMHGISEIFFHKNVEFMKEMEQPPRFALPGSVEFDFGMKWKKLYQIYKEQADQLKKNFEDEVAKIEIEQSTAQLEQQAYLLRQDLQRKQEELRQLEEQAQMEISRRMEQRRMEEDRRNQDSYRRPMEAPNAFGSNMDKQNIFGTEREKGYRSNDRTGLPQITQITSNTGPMSQGYSYDRNRMPESG